MRELRQEAIDSGSYAKKNDYLATRDDYINNTRMVKAVEDRLPEETQGQYAAHRHAADIRAERYINAEVRASKDILNGHSTESEAAEEVRRAKTEAARVADQYTQSQQQTNNQSASQTYGQNDMGQRRYFRRPDLDRLPHRPHLGRPFAHRRAYAL